MTKRRIHAEPRHFWTDAQDEQLRALYPHEPTIDVARKIGRSLSATYNRANLRGLKKSAAFLASPAAHRLDGIKGGATRFKPGNPAWNKGTHYNPGGRSIATRFKKGNRSLRWPVEDYPIGALRINTDGYLEIKAHDGSRAWKPMARFVWESERGAIPPGHVVRPLNGDQYDTRIENLTLQSRADLARANYSARYPIELRRLIQLRGAISRQINRRTREEQDRRPA